jgi:hypothetical protein
MKTTSVPFGAKSFLPRAWFLSLAKGDAFYFGASMKKCNKCGELKPLASFTLHKKIGWRELVCKTCVNTSMRDKRAENKKNRVPKKIKKASEYTRKTREKHKDRYDARKIVSVAIQCSVL